MYGKSMQRLVVSSVLFTLCPGWFFCCLYAQDISEPNSVSALEDANEVNQPTEAIAETLRDTQEEIERETQEVEQERARIAQERQTLEQSLAAQQTAPNDTAGQDTNALREQLETVRKIEEAVETREVLIQENIRSYEAIVRLIEQKLATLKNTDISFKQLDSEVRKARAEIKQLRVQKTSYQQQSENLKKEIKLLEEDVAAKEIISQLRSQAGQDTSQEVLAAQAERIEVTQAQIDQLQTNMTLIDTQLGIYQDYISVIQTKRWQQYKHGLFTNQAVDTTLRDRFILIAITVGLFLLLLTRKPVEGLISSRMKKGIGSFILQLRLLLGAGVVVLLVYFTAWLSGYQFLAYYIIGKLLLTIVILGMFHFIFRGLNLLMSLLLFRSTAGETQQDVPFFTILKGLLWLVCVSVTAIIVLRLWGVEQESYVTVLDWSKRTLFSFGSVKISILVLLKFVVLVWLFNFFAHVLNKFLEKNVYPRTRLAVSTQYSISVVMRYSLVCIGVITGLGVLGFEMATLTVLAGTIGIGIGLGLQEIAKNFISGIILLIERPVKVGDWVEIGDLPGKVKAIKARGTVIQTFDNISVVVPNSEFINQQVINWSYSDKVIRLKLPVGVEYGSNVDLVKTSLLEVAVEHPKVLKHPEPSVIFHDFGDNALGFFLYVWTNDAEHRFKILSDLHFAVNKLFAERSLVIAFPQRDIHLKTSDVVFDIKQRNEQ